MSACSILVFLLIGASIVVGADAQGDPFTEPGSTTPAPATAAPAADMPRNPNHLEPIPAYDSDGYDQAVFRSLIGEDAGELWMIGKPSFSPEYAVIIRHEIKYAKSDDFVDPKIESEKWIVEYAEAKKQIWRWKKIEGGREVLDIRVTKDVVRHRAEVSKEFSTMMFDAWHSVLRKTRYPDADYRGCDGATFQFYCRYNLFGEIWTPTRGLPSILTDLGYKLAEVAKAEAQNRPKLVAECTVLAKKIKAETEKPEQPAAGQPATNSEPK